MFFFGQTYESKFMDNIFKPVYFLAGNRHICWLFCSQPVLLHGLLVFPTHSCYICIIQVQVYHVSLVLLSHGRCSYGKW